MNMKIWIIIPLLAAVFLFSCNKHKLKKCTEHIISDCVKDKTKTNIRIKNISEYDFCNVVITPPGGSVNYGIIKENRTSCYTTFDLAYRYAPIELFIDGEEFVLNIIDYVGEPELGVGNFTYEIDVTNFSDKRLSIAAVED